MLCGAKLRCKDAYCKKHALAGKARCSLHGALSLSGKDHWNYQHGRCTKKYRKASVEGNARIKLLEQLAISLGMIES